MEVSSLNKAGHTWAQIVKIMIKNVTHMISNISFTSTNLSKALS